MSSFTFYFKNEIEEKLSEFTVKRVGEAENVKIVVEHKPKPNKTVSLKFDASKPLVIGQNSPILAYLRFLVRKHIEWEFEDNLGWPYIKHESGKICSFQGPKFKYENKYNKLIHKKSNLVRLIKDLDQSTGAFYQTLNKVTKLDKKLDELGPKHRQDIQEQKSIYMTKTLSELSGIFEDLLILISDAHEVTVT